MIERIGGLNPELGDDASISRMPDRRAIDPGREVLSSFFHSITFETLAPSKGLNHDVEAPSLDQLHPIEMHATLVPDREDGDDVGVMELRHRLRLDSKPEQLVTIERRGEW